MTFGLARALFNTDCIIAPDTEKAHPARAAAKVLGNLTYLIILKFFSVISPSLIDSMPSDKGIFVEPIQILNNIPIVNKIIRRTISVIL
jgi:hypothetical protein